MHTVMVVTAGVALLALCALGARVLGGRSAAATAALVFVPIWLIAAGVNMYIGVARAGYTVAAEAPIFLVVFGIPAAMALLVRRSLRRPSPNNP